MFKQLHINITLADALILMPKYQKMLKALLSNREKLQELANIPLNENCSAVILKKLPEKLGDREKFLISCGFSELKHKALADLGASINLMPLSIWKKLGSGSLPSNIVSNPKGELKSITTCSGLVIDGPTVPTPPQSINPEVDKHVEKTFTDSNLAELTRDQSSNPTSSTNTNPKGHNRRSSKKRVEDSNLEEQSHPVVMMADNRTMAEMLRAPTEGYAKAIVVPLILAEQFEPKHSLINMMTTDQFFGIEKDNPHDHIRAARRWLEKEPPRSITNWEDLAWDRYKDLLRACPHHGFTELHQLDTFFNALNPADQDSLNTTAGGNLLERSTQDVLTIIENKSKVCNSRNKPIVSQVKACDVNSNSEIAKLTHAVNQQTSAITTAMTAMLIKFQATQPPTLVKAVEEICVTCGGVDERVEETYTDPNLAEYTIKVPPPPAQKYNPPSQREFVVHQRDPRHSNIPYPSRMLNQKQQEKVEVQIQKFWQMFKQLHINITLADALILMPKYQKMLKALLSNKEKLQELANTPLNENCSAVIIKNLPKKLGDPGKFLIPCGFPVIIKKLPKKLGDPGKFLIPCGFSKLKCKALAYLGASINLMPLSVWKKLGLPELIPTRMTLELANHAICTPTEIARDVFVSVGKFTFPADFVIVDYEIDPRVPLILERPFLRTARALIDVHGEEMILRDGDERLTLNMRHDTEDYLEDFFPKRPSGNPTFSPHPELPSPEVTNDIFDSEGCNVLSEKLPDLDSTKDLHPHFHDNPLSGSTTYSFSSNSSLEEFTDELALNTYPPEYDDNLQFDIESDLKEIEFLLYHDKDSNEHTPDYSSPPIFDVYDDEFLEVESDSVNVYDNPFDSKGEKIKEFTLLIDELDLPCDFLLPSEYDSFNSHDFSRVDVLPSTNNDDKVFNPGILIQEKPVEIITHVVQDKKLAIFNASLVFEDFDPPFYEPLFFKLVPKSKMLLLFLSENEEKVFKPGVHTFEKVHSYFIQELSYPGYHVFKINQIFKCLMEIFLVYYGKNMPILDVPIFHCYPP
nr:reverse transcriptase domain-containing protein [Tanacetum cinerariifolium]